MTNLTRRGLLAGTVAATAAGLLLPYGVAAQEAQPKVGGSMRIGMSGAATSDTLDPALFLSGPVIIGMLAVCNTLVEIDHTGKAVPDLAESVEPDAGAVIWTFKIRSDATFGDGKAVTAKDVIASFNHHRGEASKSGAKGPLEQVKDIRADGDHTVIFELNSGNADFATITADYHYLIMPANEDGTMNWQSGLGTGGYTLEHHDPGVRVSLKRRGDYFKKDRAWFETVEIIAISDPTARQNALMTGEVDVINAPDLATVGLLKRRPGISLVETTGTAHYTMPMLTNGAPLNDNNVRLALKYAINREEFLEKILHGYGKVANDTPITPANRYYAADLPQHSYDPDKAKFHLKQAGMDSLDIDLSASETAFTGAVNAAQLFQQSAKACGINVTVKREPEDNYWTNVWMKKPFCMGYWNGRPTEDDMFSLTYASGAEWNESFWENEKFNQLLITARTELNDAKRREMYHEMQAIVSEDGGTIIPVFVNYVDAKNDKVAHGPVAGDRFFDGWKIVERWWAA